MKQADLFRVLDEERRVGRRRQAVDSSIGKSYPIWRCPHGIDFGLYMAGSAIVFTGLRADGRIFGERRCDDCGDLPRALTDDFQRTAA